MYTVHRREERQLDTGVENSVITGTLTGSKKQRQDQITYSIKMNLNIT